MGVATGIVAEAVGFTNGEGLCLEVIIPLSAVEEAIVDVPEVGVAYMREFDVPDDGTALSSNVNITSKIHRGQLTV